MTCFTSRSSPPQLRTMSSRTAALLLSVGAAGAFDPLQAPSQTWAPLVGLLNDWQFTRDFAVTVGNASGIVFNFQKGSMTLDTRVKTASTSKWPMAMALASAVADGTIKSLDTKANEVIPWWTKNVSDSRNMVTLRHLLSFTSGFGSGSPGGSEKPATTCEKDQHGDYETCSRLVYNTTQVMGTPGTVYSYNGVHLRLAMVMVMKASGLTLHQVLDKYLVKGLRMASTTCDGFNTSGVISNPDLSACLTVTGKDYGNFLSGIFDYSLVRKAIVEESEVDYTPFLDGYSLYGHYGFGHFLECFDNPAGMTEACKAAKVHADPGGFGYYPLIDRKYNYWMQIVAFEFGDRYGYSGIPEYLRLLVKPYVDAVMRGEDLQSGDRDRFSALSIADFNYIAKCGTDPQSCV